MKNDQGDTPLHLAAAIGNLDLCWCISSQDKSLIAERNKEGETPLFQAARHGQEKAFFYLRYRYGESDIPLDMLIKNGDTILHFAIKGEYYGFALRIIHCYPELVDTMNENNLTPLHVAAAAMQVVVQMMQRKIYKDQIEDRLIRKWIIAADKPWQFAKD
ncbi:hypothetical protein CRG98_026504 [Punica granatum]|uniref:Uncharacterized protein n=1 Tax=Punica granatum TaxID=22663 RepID=A0A2I0JA27_PUNGR|nr:hypothetical protein CRG98_026504 [Punica granatum]